jgi:PatG C-terminal
MDQTEAVELSAAAGARAERPPSAPRAELVAPQTGAGAGCGCGGAGAVADESAVVTNPFVFAIGRVEMRFPSLAVEKEFAQAAGRDETAGLTDREALAAVITRRENRYLARHVCWVFTIEGLETYILRPRDPADFDLLLEAVRPQPSPLDLDVVVGLRGPVARPETCNGLTVPVVVFDQLYSFDRELLIKAIPRPESVAARQERQFRAAAAELFERIMQLADNAGSTDEHRAINYLAVRYPAIYALATEANARNQSLTSVEARPSRLSQTRNVVDIVFAFTNRETDVTEKFFVRVDVTEEFPFLVTKLSPYYDR